MTLPVYNEVQMLSESVNSILHVLSESGLDFTLSIAEDGSDDGTKDCIQQLCHRFPGILVQSVPEKHGRGWALRTLWSRVDADLYAFSDVDLAANPKFLVQAIQLALDGRPIVIGSRYVPGAIVIRPPLRSWVSKGYNWLVRVLFHDRVMDHQCGLKVFSAQAIRTLLPYATESSWFWDTEVLVLASEKSIDVTELPVEWTERKSMRTGGGRLLSDLYIHGVGLIRLKGKHPSTGRSRHAVNRKYDTTSDPVDDSTPGLRS